MRYLPLTEADRRSMLAAAGVDDVDALFRDVPAAARLPGPVSELPLHADEMTVERAFRGFAGRNLSPGNAPCFLGAGAYRHHVPASVDHLIQRGEFLTAYTPYQPEVAQGTLQYLFEFQTQVALLTGMEVANASLYDGATATAEAVLMAARITRRPRVVLSGGLHPHARDVTATNARFMGLDLVQMAPDWDGGETVADALDATTACVVVQNPDVFGRIRDLAPLAAACHAAGALLLVVVNEVVSLGAIRSPGEMGADIVAAEGQSLGNATSFGGPTVGLFAIREKFVRQMPGRLVGETVDADGRRGFVLTLSTREQHIRREKATSNICTNSGLCALAFTIHLTLLGEAGFTRLAKLNHAAAVALADRLAAIPAITVMDGPFFNEFTVRLPKPATAVVEALAARGILAGVPAARLFPEADHAAAAERLLLVAATETNSEDDMDRLAMALEEVLR
ncbi:MAG: aminomethyl-transferring glycine dehydrogenase subunit GcvPA [Rhodospirillales bacterium]|nr:MAG: aminomethyl-transferring glycine dehydrogenase subunit GcvPA [Rhodospirillales bacterium]